MLEVLEHPDLPQGDLLDQGIVLALNELLDGDEVARVPRPTLVHHAVAALAYLTQLLVPIQINCMVCVSVIPVSHKIFTKEVTLFYLAQWKEGREGKTIALMKKLIDNMIYIYIYRSMSLDGALDILSSVLFVSKREERIILSYRELQIQV